MISLLPEYYHVCVHSFDHPGRFAVYTVQLAEQLPRIAVPSLPGDEAVTVDLQAIFARCDDAEPYGRRARYELARIVPALSEKQREWATELLQVRGLLTPTPATPTEP